MKKLSISLMLVVCTFLMLKAQDNVVKIGYADLGKITLSYERVINDNQTANLRFALLPTRSVPNFILTDNVKELNLDNELGGFSIMPEYRFYLGSKDAPRGFYLGPYLKYSKYSGEFSDEFEGNLIQVNADINAIGLGLQLGVQWILSDVVSIDWEFLGLEFNSNNLEVGYTSDIEGIDFGRVATQVEKDYADLPIVGEKLEITSGDDFVKGTATALFPGIRTGISIGYAF